MSTRWLAANWFLLGLAGAVALAWAFPGLGAKDGPLAPGVTGKLAIALIFFLQGLFLDGAALRRGAGQWKLHALVQAFTFVAFPVAGLVLDALGGSVLPPSLRLGFLYLFVLPSTVSTAVVYTTQAGGNTPAAIFNATLSSVIGIFATPLWTGALLGVSGADASGYNPWAVLGQLVVLVLFPLVAGMVIRPMVRSRVDPHKKKLGNTNSSLVLFMVFTAFCDSFTQRVWSGLEPWVLVAVVAGVGASLAVASALAWWLAGVVGLARPERITALFCAPQKTLASGVPMAKLLFAARPDLGLILLPLMLYHPLQLLIGGLLVDRFARAGREPR